MVYYNKNRRYGTCSIPSVNEGGEDFTTTKLCSKCFCCVKTRNIFHFLPDCSKIKGSEQRTMSKSGG